MAPKPIPRITPLHSNRTGLHWMDGHAIIAQGDSVHLRPWDDCIPLRALSSTNLPPFYVRLRDDQVGALLRWLNANHKAFNWGRVKNCWPADFNVHGSQILLNRTSWGPGFVARDRKDRELLLNGSEAVPEYQDPGLPLTYTSSGKIMRRDIDESAEILGKKRGADDFEEEPDKKEARVDDDDGLGFTTETSKTTKSKAKKTTAQKNEKPQDDVHQTLTKMVDALISEKTKLESRVKTLESEMEPDKTKIKELEKELKDMKDENEAHVSKLEKVIKDMRDENAAHITELARLNNSWAKFKSDVHGSTGWFDTHFRKADGSGDPGEAKADA